MRIEVSDYCVPVLIGVLPEEQGKTQRLSFTVTLEVHDPGWIQDNIADTFNYADVIADLDALQHQQHTGLLETLCQQLAENWLNHEAVLSVRVSIKKLDLLPNTATVGLQREFRRKRLTKPIQ